MKRHLLLYILMMPIGLLAQELINSQFYINRVFTNPAYTGEASGARFIMNSRVQWRSLPSNVQRAAGNFQLHTASLDMPLCAYNSNAGVGLRASHETHGEAGLQTNSFYGMFSYKIVTPKWRKAKNFFRGVRFGLDVGFLQRSLNGNNLVFSDQIDPVRGYIGSSSNSGLTYNSKAAFNSSAGGVVNLYEDNGKGTAYKVKKVLLGYSIYNMFSPSVNLLSGNDERLRRRHSFQATFSFYSNDKSLPLNLNFRHLRLEGTPSNATDFFINAVKRENSKGPTAAFTLGGGFRVTTSEWGNTQSILSALGFTWGNGGQILLGADFGVGGLNEANLSTWELSLVLSLSKGCKGINAKGKSGRGSVIGCPDF